jgi:toxin ParE1/3/4
MPPVVILRAAQNDLLDQAEYFDSQGGETLGDRFLARCETGFERIAAFPESGTRVRLRHPKLEGCRFILAPEFDRILIFYRLDEGKIQIVRVLHGARDIETALDEKSDETQH